MLAFVLGVVNAFDMPIRQSFVVEMVGRADIATAVALNSAVFNGGPHRRAGHRRPAHRRRRHRALLPPQRRRATWRSIVGYLLMRTSRAAATRRAPRRPHRRARLGSLVEGLRYVRATPVILLCIVTLGVVSTSGSTSRCWYRSGARHPGRRRRDLRLPDGRRRRRLAHQCAGSRPACGPTLRLLFVGAAVLGLAVALSAVQTMLPAPAGDGHRGLVA